jgi:L-aspartate oxidase
MRPLLEDSDAGIGIRRLALETPARGTGADVVACRHELQHVMTRCAGVVRNGASLAEAAAAIDDLAGRCGAASTDPARAEVANLVAVAGALVAAAAERTESRGAHTRDDHPATDDGQRERLVLTIAPG